MVGFLSSAFSIRMLLALIPLQTKISRATFSECVQRLSLCRFIFLGKCSPLYWLHVLLSLYKKKKPIVYMFDSDQDNMVVLYKLPWNPNCKLLVDLPFLKTPNVDLDCESSVLSLPFFFHGQVLITNPWRRIRPRRQLRPRMRRQRPRSLKLTKHGPRRLRLRRLLLFGESERRIIWMIGFLHLTLGSS